jgi:hypothetical protein
MTFKRRTPTDLPDPSASSKGGVTLNTNFNETKLGRAKRIVSSNIPNLTPSVMSSPPTITALAAGTNSTITNKVFYAITSTKINVPWSSRLATSSTSSLNDGVSRSIYRYGTQVTGSNSPVIFKLNTDAPVIEIMNSGGSFLIQCICNGQFVGATALSVSPAFGNLIKYDFGSRANRDLVFIATAGLGGFYIGPNDTVWPSESGRSTMSVGWMGDSYSQSNGAGVFGCELSTMTAIRLGATDVWTDAVGGSGYASTNGGVSPSPNKFIDRLGYSTLSNQDFTIHVTAGGINDPTPTGSSHTTAVAAYFAQLRSMYPTTVFVALGPFTPNGNNATSGQGPAVRDQTLAGLQTISGPWAFIDNLAGTWTNSAGVSGEAGNGAWQTGTGKVGTTTGTGNGDIYVSSDGTHPSGPGATYLEERMTTSIRDSILAL